MSRANMDTTRLICDLLDLRDEFVAKFLAGKCSPADEGEFEKEFDYIRSIHRMVQTIDPKVNVRLLMNEVYKEIWGLTK